MSIAASQALAKSQLRPNLCKITAFCKKEKPFLRIQTKMLKKAKIHTINTTDLGLG